MQIFVSESYWPCLTVIFDCRFLHVMCHIFLVNNFISVDLSSCEEQHEAKEKYREMFETQKSDNKTSSREIGLDIRTCKSQRARCPEEQASCVGILHPLQMFHGNLAQLGKKSNSVIRSTTVAVKNWCNVLSMEVVTVYGHHPECRVKSGRRGHHIAL